MIVLLSICLMLLIAYLTYAIGLPFFRHKPIFLTVKKLRISFALIALVVMATNIAAGLILATLIVATYIKEFEIVIGLSSAQFGEASARTISGILADAHVDPERPLVIFAKPMGEIAYHRVLENNNVLLIEYRLPKTPKTELFKEDVRKIIDNYPITF